VLPKRAFGREAGDFEVDIGSGYTRSTDVADATLDPKDTAGQIVRAGWVAGYDLSFSDLSGAPLVRGGGLLYVDSSLDVFSSARAADGFLTKQATDTRRLRGQRVELGVRLAASGTFPVGSLGERSVGLRTTVSFGDVRFYDTLVAFRVGSLVAAVGVERTDAKATTALSLRLARQLAARIRLAATGKPSAQAVPVPLVGKKGAKPSGGPDLASMALTAGDLPRGTTLSRQGYVDDDAALATYEREFDTSAAKFPATMVESDLSLFRHSREAAGFLLGVRLLYASPYVEQDFAADWGQPTLKIEQRASLTVGEESAALVIRAPSADNTPARIVSIQFRVGRILGTVTVAGPASSLRLAEATKIAATFARRIQRASTV
jgi:hypothetical protein